MTIRPIARMGHPVLKKPAEAVTEFDDPELDALVEDMAETMLEVGGVGIAAPQIYVPKRVVIFFVPKDRTDGEPVPLTVMVNPVIKPAGMVQEEDWEACLSVPGLTGMVPRHTAITYSFQDLAGETHEREASGFHARVVQHECDHLDGMLYPMRMTDMSTLMYTDVADDIAPPDEDLADDDIPDFEPVKA